MVPVKSPSSGHTYYDQENHVDVANYTSRSVLKRVSSSDYEAKYNFLNKRWDSKSVFIRNFDKMSEISCSDKDFLQCILKGFSLVMIMTAMTITIVTQQR